MSDLLTSEDLKTERATEPPKRWRNWYRAILPVEIHAPNTTLDLKPGAEFYGSPFPTKEIAEQKALDELSSNAASAHGIQYLGAFPDGEAP